MSDHAQIGMQASQDGYHQVDAGCKYIFYVYNICGDRVIMKRQECRPG